MRFLLSNDDGWQAPGLQTLFSVFETEGEVTLVAPDRNRSGASNSLTLDRPLRIHQVQNNMYSVDGTPTDCVHVAVTGLLEDEPDMVISGINSGANMGDDVLYSGTVAAAMEGRFLGLPAIALSSAAPNPQHYDAAAQVGLNIVRRVLSHPLPNDTILNVNIPDCPLDEITGYEVTRLGNRHRSEAVIKADDPRGKPIYWIGAAGGESDAGPGTDFYAVNNYRVSITPIQTDLTRYATMDDLSAWSQGL